MKSARKTFAVLMLFLFTICAGCSSAGSYKTINATDAVKMMQTEKDYLIIDVRTQEEYDKKHIPGAVLVPIADLREGKFEKLPNKNQTLLIYCWTGRRAEDSAKLLAENGYTKVYTFGGLVEWNGDLEGTEISE